MLLKGIGWGNMPVPMVQEDLDSGRLVHLDLPDTKGRLQQDHLSGRYATRPARRLIARLKPVRMQR